MIRLRLQICEQQLLSAGLITASGRLNGNEQGIDFLQDGGIVELKGPAAVGLIVHIEDPEI